METGRGRKYLLMVGILLVLVLILIIYLKNSEKDDKQFSVTFFNIGQGDAALIRFDNGQKMLVDCGPNKKILSKLGKALPFFDRKIDYLLVTHPDGDHYGGCPAVLERYEVNNIISNGAKKPDLDPFWQAWSKYYDLEVANKRIINGEEKINIGSTEINIYSPNENLGMDFDRAGGNDRSIVFLLKSSIGSFLFTGDMEEKLENAILKKYCTENDRCPKLHADYLKVGHHGSDSSTGKELLEAVNPKYAIISVGPNKFGHPSLRVIRKLERIGAQIWRTDIKNDIIIK